MDLSVPLLDFQNVTVQRGDRMVLDGVTLSIAQGEHAAILGPNGSGKSTLIKVISRELYPRLKPSPGRCASWAATAGASSTSATIWASSPTIGCSCARATIPGFEIVLSGFFGSVGIWPNHHVTAEMERKAREVMELLEIAHLAERNTNEMSSGEARRILIARALVHDPQALMLDEPTTSLDLHATHELREILRKLAAARHRHPHGDPPPARHHPRNRPRGDAARGNRVRRWSQARFAPGRQAFLPVRHSRGGAAAGRLLPRALTGLFRPPG